MTNNLEQPLEKTLSKVRANYIQELVDQGCDEAELTGFLTAIKWAEGREKWDRLTGMTPKRMRDVIVKNLHEMAADITQINANLGFFLEVMQHPKEYRKLPTLLSDYAKDLENLSRTGGTKRHPLLQELKCELVRYVEQKTGRVCDQEVAGLLNNILKNPNYDAVAHRVFRERYCK